MSRPITGAEAGRILRVATALRTLLVWFGAHLLLAMGLAVSMFSSLEGGQPSPLLLPLSAVSLLWPESWPWNGTNKSEAACASPSLSSSALVRVPVECLGEAGLR